MCKRTEFATKLQKSALMSQPTRSEGEILRIETPAEKKLIFADHSLCSGISQLERQNWGLHLCYIIFYHQFSLFA